MKILHICTTQYTDKWTYQENLLAKYHRKMGHEVYLITSMYCYKDGVLTEDTVNRFTDCNGVNIIRLQKKNSLLGAKLPSFEKFYETIEEVSPDLIFSHGCQYRDIACVAKYCKAHPECELRVDNHADYINSATNWLSKNILHKKVWKHYAKKIYPYVKIWYGVTPARIDFLVDIYKIPRDKIRLLVMGADDELVTEAIKPEKKAEIRRKYKIKDNDFLIITGGKITSAKRRVIDLMEAVNRINRENVKLIVFGSVSPELKDALEGQCSDKVQYIGWVESQESASYFAASDLVVFPGLHSVFWEQVVAVGVPMVCSHFSGMEHIDLGGNVRFLYGKDDEIYNTLLSILDDGSYPNMKKTAVEKGFETFTYSSIAAKTISEVI